MKILLILSLLTFALPGHTQARGEMMKAFQNVEITEKVQESGDIHVLIIPKNKNITLDIQTSEKYITIKSETKVEETSTEQGHTFQSYSSSSSSQMIGIPRGFKVKSSKAQGTGINIILSTNQKIKKLIPKTKKYPLGKQVGEELI
jgi:hypothetical protein